MAKITVIDDSQATLDMIADILKTGDHDISTHIHSKDIEASIVAEKPDLILLDVVMPERNGYEVLRALRRNPETKDIPVILVSSKNEPTDVKWGKRQGAVDYVTKPFTSKSILSAVNEHL